jgi:electron transfer flavoprotein alpha subunit
MKEAIFTVLESHQGKVSQLSWESLGAAQELAASLGTCTEAIVIGWDDTRPAAEAASYDVRRVIHISGRDLERYTPDAFVMALSDVLKQLDAHFVILPHSYQVREFAPKLAAKMDRAFLSDCTAFRRDGEDLVFSRQLYQGKVYADISFAGPSPYFVSVQAGSFRAAQRSTNGSVAPTNVINIPEHPEKIRTRPMQRVQESTRTVDLSASEVIVAVGRGIKEAENLPLVEQLAEALGGQIGGSRPVCDSGWLPMDRQVGSSGQTVAPKLYFAIGISGAIQHVVGMKGSRKIVAINKDPNAPIFEVADIGIVGDLFDVVPAITNEISRLKEARDSSHHSLNSDS